jgi:hypothetical protein
VNAQQHVKLASYASVRINKMEGSSTEKDPSLELLFSDRVQVEKMPVSYRDYQFASYLPVEFLHLREMAGVSEESYRVDKTDREQNELNVN